MKVVHYCSAGQKTVKGNLFLVLVPKSGSGDIGQIITEKFGIIGGYFLFQKKYLEKIEGIIKGHNFESIVKPCSGFFVSLSFLTKSSVKNLFENHLPFVTNQTLYLIIPRFWKNKKKILQEFKVMEQERDIEIVVVIGDKAKVYEVNQMFN